MNIDDTDVLELARRVLTERQWQVWELDDRGFSQYQIAAALGIGRGTVRDHLQAATRRVAKAMRDGRTSE